MGRRRGGVAAPGRLGAAARLVRRSVRQRLAGAGSGAVPVHRRVQACRLRSASGDRRARRRPAGPRRRTAPRRSRHRDSSHAAQRGDRCRWADHRLLPRLVLRPAVARPPRGLIGVGRVSRVSPAIKYTLGRVGLFVVIFAVLLPVPLNFLVRLMIALFASAGFSYFLLAKWRNEMAEQLGSVADRRKRERSRLRAALAGDEDAAAAGDRAAGSAATTTTAGPVKAATAGLGGATTAGGEGAATAGPGGTATAGPGGTATAGPGGTATAGPGGTATAGPAGATKAESATTAQAKPAAGTSADGQNG